MKKFREDIKKAFMDAMMSEDGKVEPKEEAEVAHFIFSRFCNSGKVSFENRVKKLDEEVRELATESFILDKTLMAKFNLDKESTTVKKAEEYDADAAAVALRYMYELADVMAVTLGEIYRIADCTGMPMGIIERHLLGLVMHKFDKRENGDINFGHDWPVTVGDCITTTQPIDDLPF